MSSQVSSTAQWPVPAGLSAKGREAAQVIVEFLREKELTDHGGGGRFYSPQEWQDRGESYGLGSLLIVTHDGGDHAGVFNWDYEQYGVMEELRQKLAAIGVFAEQCTGWYSAVYLTGGGQ